MSEANGDGDAAGPLPLQPGLRWAEWIRCQAKTLGLDEPDVQQAEVLLREHSGFPVTGPEKVARQLYEALAFLKDTGALPSKR